MRIMFPDTKQQVTPPKEPSSNLYQDMPVADDLGLPKETGPKTVFYYSDGPSAMITALKDDTGKVVFVLVEPKKKAISVHSGSQSVFKFLANGGAPIK